MSRYLFLVLYLSILVFSMAQERCYYYLYIETGDPGTTSNIDLVLSGHGSKLSIDNLKVYGLNGPDYSYFQTNQRDFFQFASTCLTDVCNVTVISDGSGSRPSWFVGTAGVAVYKIVGSTIEQIPFVVRYFPFKVLLANVGTTASSSSIATDCSNLRSAIGIDGVPQGVSSA